MSRLAIVISAVSGVEPLESTLVSVLENRPRDVEIIVVANFAYDDPYDLAGEVRIMAAPGNSDFALREPGHCRDARRWSTCWRPAAP